MTVDKLYTNLPDEMFTVNAITAKLTSQFQWTRHHRLTNIFHLPFTNNSSLQRSLAETIRLVHTPGSKQFPMKSFCCSDLLTNLLEKKKQCSKILSCQCQGSDKFYARSQLCIVRAQSSHIPGSRIRLLFYCSSRAAYPPLPVN